MEKEVLTLMDQVSPLFTLCIPIIAVIMETLRVWIDKQNKLKPFWLYIAIGLSAIGSTIFMFIEGWNLQLFFIQGAVIYGGQQGLQQLWFKRIWPVIKGLSKKKKA